MPRGGGGARERHRPRILPVPDLSCPRSRHRAGGYGYWLPPYGTAYRRALRTTRTRIRTRMSKGEEGLPRGGGGAREHAPRILPVPDLSCLPVRHDRARGWNAGGFRRSWVPEILGSGDLGGFRRLARVRVPSRGAGSSREGRSGLRRGRGADRKYLGRSPGARSCLSWLRRGRGADSGGILGDEVCGPAVGRRAGGGARPARRRLKSRPESQR